MRIAWIMRVKRQTGVFLQGAWCSWDRVALLEGKGLLIAAWLACVACQQQRPVVQQQQRPVVTEETYRAFKMLQAATASASGVTKPTYDEHLQRIGGELAIAADLAVDSSEIVAVRRYTLALLKYQDAGIVWSEKIKNDGTEIGRRAGAIPRNHFAVRTNAQASAILSHYGFTARRVNEYWTIAPDTSIWALWQQASSDVTAANALVVPLLRRR